MGPKRMSPPQLPRKLGKIKAKKLQIFEENLIRDHSTREKVISVMNRVHREVIDPVKFIRLSPHIKSLDILLIPCPENHSPYDEGMEVELKMENYVGLETLVKNVGKVMTGKFLLCRTITPSSKMVGVDTAVEDVEGEMAVRLALFNYSMEAKMGKHDFEGVLPLGTVLIVKNPVFKKALLATLVYGVIAENPADVEILSPKRMAALFPDVKWKSDLPQESRALLKSPPFWEFPLNQTDLEIATRLKNVGNKAFIENRATDAIRFYNVGLEYLPEGEGDQDAARTTLLVDILTNKAAALIKLECFNAALICTEKVLAINEGHVKAIYRHAKALIGLGRYSEGGEFLDDKLVKFQEAASKDIVKLGLLISELQKPTPSKEILLALRSPRPRNSNEAQTPLPVGMVDLISEFRGPIQLGPSPISNQGLFATEDLEPDTLLMVCKPFAGLYVDSARKTEFSFNCTCHEYLVGVITNKIWLDPDLARDLYTLWAGPDLKYDESKTPTKVDMARIHQICKFNFTGTRCFDEKDDTFISCGVWVGSSKINNSCIDANVTCVHHDSGLVMMVTTFKAVKKGEEILTSYVDPMLSLTKERNFELSGFTCNCRLCELDRSESPTVIAKRQKLLASLAYDPVRKFYPFHPTRLAGDLESIAELDRLRGATPDLNLALVDGGIFTIAAIVLLGLRRYEECFAIMEKIYRVVQNIPTNFLYRAHAEVLLVCCMKMGKKKVVLQKWVEEVRKYCRRYGGSLEHVRKGDHPSLPEDLKKFGIEFFNEEETTD